MKRQTRWPLMVVVIMLIMAALACEFSFSTASIKNAKMTTGEDGKTKTTVYQPGDTFYCVVELSSAPDDTKTKAVWYATQAEGTEPDYKIGEYELESGSATLTFNVAPTTAWPPGQYRVEIYLNGEKKKTVNFEVAP
jgi:cell division protein YceG involved in septum cleavage